jgi:23S rRNA (guanosine2251-2'-O)-methyltransferase
MIVSRIHPVEEAVKARPREIEWVLFDSERRDRRVAELKNLCRSQGVSVRNGERRSLDQLAGPSHQGVVARLAVREYRDESEAVAGERGERLLLVLDEVQDPHNLGAAIRVAEGLGAGVVVPERGSAPLSETVSRSSAGAVERVPIYRAKNLRRFVDHLKNEGFHVVGMDPEGRDLYEIDLRGDLALVLGAEGKGIRRLVREGCDELARLPMRGKLASLNVSTAAAAAGYEALRQRLSGDKKRS